MTSQNPTRADAKTATPPRNDNEPAAGERPEVKRELTDDEIASVTGGVIVVGKGQTGSSFHGERPY